MLNKTRNILQEYMGIPRESIGTNSKSGFSSHPCPHTYSFFYRFLVDDDFKQPKLNNVRQFFKRFTTRKQIPNILNRLLNTTQAIKHKIKSRLRSLNETLGIQ